MFSNDFFNWLEDDEVCTSPTNYMYFDGIDFTLVDDFIVNIKSGIQKYSNGDIKHNLINSHVEIESIMPKCETVITMQCGSGKLVLYIPKRASPLNIRRECLYMDAYMKGNIINFHQQVKKLEQIYIIGSNIF